MDGEIFVSKDGYFDSNGHQILASNIDLKNDDELFEITEYFKKELLGYTKYTLDFFKEEVYQFSKKGKDTTKMSSIERMLYYRDRKKKEKKIIEEKNIAESDLKEIKELISKITTLCAKYDLDLNGDYKRNSFCSEIGDMLSKSTNKNTIGEYYSQIKIIRAEIIQARKMLENKLQKYSSLCAFLPYYNRLKRILYFQLTKVKEDGCVILDTILNSHISEKKELYKNDSETSFKYDSHTDFKKESLLNIPSDILEELTYLESSNHMKDSEKELLKIVHNAYINLAESKNKLQYINAIIARLKKDSRFKKLVEMLELAKKNLDNQILVESQKAKELYDQYDVKAQVKLMQEKDALAVEQGELLYKIEKEREKGLGESRDLDPSVQLKLNESANEEKKVDSKTLMAQYLRARAFKTEDGKLSWQEFVNKYATEYNLEEKEVLEFDEEQFKNGSRKV